MEVEVNTLEKQNKKDTNANKKAKDKLPFYAKINEEEKKLNENLLNIEIIKEYIAKRKIDWTKHCLNRLNQRDILISDVKTAVNNGKIMNCFMCKGNLEEKKVNYVVDLDNTIIIIKGVPAKVCTQCGEQYFDDETAENIEKIVNQLKQLATEVTIVNYKEKVA